MTSWEEVLLKPVISEESLKIAEEHNEYTFLVGRGATKAKIKEAIEKSFAVKVEEVRTKLTKGKVKRRGAKRLTVRGQNARKAIVRLSPKDKISLFETKEKKKIPRVIKKKVKK